MGAESRPAFVANNLPRDHDPGLRDTDKRRSPHAVVAVWRRRCGRSADRAPLRRHRPILSHQDERGHRRPRTTNVLGVRRAAGDVRRCRAVSFLPLRYRQERALRAPPRKTTGRTPCCPQRASSSEGRCSATSSTIRECAYGRLEKRARASGSRSVSPRSSKRW